MLPRDVQRRLNGNESTTITPHGCRSGYSFSLILLARVLSLVFSQVSVVRISSDDFPACSSIIRFVQVSPARSKIARSDVSGVGASSETRLERGHLLPMYILGLRSGASFTKSRHRIQKKKYRVELD